MADETTVLTPDEERAFQKWGQANNLSDLNSPEAHYDYRGFWKANPNFQHTPGQHFTDQFKQHGHPTFSQESQYSSGPSDGGMWVGPNGATDPADTFLAQPRMAVSHQQPLRALLLAALKGGS